MVACTVWDMEARQCQLSVFELGDQSMQSMGDCQSLNLDDPSMHSMGGHPAWAYQGLKNKKVNGEMDQIGKGSWFCSLACQFAGGKKQEACHAQHACHVNLIMPRQPRHATSSLACHVILGMLRGHMDPFSGPLAQP